MNLPDSFANPFQLGTHKLLLGRTPVTTRFLWYRAFRSARIAIHDTAAHFRRVTWATRNLPRHGQTPTLRRASKHARFLGIGRSLARPWCCSTAIFNLCRYVADAARRRRVGRRTLYWGKGQWGRRPRVGPRSARFVLQPPRHVLYGYISASKETRGSYNRFSLGLCPMIPRVLQTTRARLPLLPRLQMCCWLDGDQRSGTIAVDGRRELQDWTMKNTRHQTSTAHRRWNSSRLTVNATSTVAWPGLDKMQRSASCLPQATVVHDCLDLQRPHHKISHNPRCEHLPASSQP